MADINLPRQVALVLEQFPKADWSRALVNALNQFALEVVQAFRFSRPNYKTLSVITGPTVADTFPIVFQVESMPVDVWIAATPVGDTGTAAITVKWQPIVSNSSQLGVSVNLITGLSADTTYSIRLGYR